MNFIPILLIPALGHIVYTDFKEYKISLLTVIFASLVSFFRLFTVLDKSILVQTVILNSMFILILLGVLYIYCRFRSIKFLNAFGLGDVLFLVVALLSFAPFSFVIYIIASSFLGIIYFLTSRVLKKQEQQIPYAGIMAAVLLLVIVLDLTTTYSSFTDNWLIFL